MQTATGTLGRVEPIDRSTLAEEIYRRLRRAILGGELGAGEPVRPDKLAADIGVSRTPVREALQRLLADGYLEQEARHAFRVAAVDYQSGRELFAIRAVLEGLAARQAASKLSEEDRLALLGTLALTDEGGSGDWSEPAERAVGDFHRIVYRAAANRHLSQQLDRVFDLSLRYRFLTRSDTPDRKQETLSSHRELYELIAAGKAVEAEAMMREHVAALGRRFEATAPSA